MRISKRFPFTVLSISDAGKVQVSNRGNQFGVLLIDLSKAFDCIDHKLLIAKLCEYGVSSSVLNIIYFNLKHRTQRAKINDTFSARSNIEYSVPHGSILGLLVFNVNMIDLFYESEENDIANYADDTTPYSRATDIPTVFSELQAQQKFLIGLVIII